MSMPRYTRKARPLQGQCSPKATVPAPRNGQLSRLRRPANEEDSHLGDLIEDKNAVLPIDAAIQSSLRDTTTRVLALLSAREERIVRMRFLWGLMYGRAGRALVSEHLATLPRPGPKLR
jgi:hypothetical protein